MEARSGCARSEEHTSELQSRRDLVCRLLLEKKKTPALLKPVGADIHSRYSCPHISIPGGSTLSARRRLPRSARHVSFFFNDTATAEIYTLSLHDALPI